MVAFDKELGKEAGKDQYMLHNTEDEVVEKVSWMYRGLISKHFNKSFATKHAPHNSKLPQCAHDGIRKVVSVEHGDGYDSLLDDNPYMRAMGLDRQDNKRELKEMQKSTGVKLPAKVQAAYKNTFPYSDSEEEASSDEEDQPLASLQRKNKRQKKGAERNAASHQNVGLLIITQITHTLHYLHCEGEFPLVVFFEIFLGLPIITAI